MKQGAPGRRRGLELGWSLPSRGPLARVDVLTPARPGGRRARLLDRHDLGPRRPADALVGAVPLRHDRRVPGRLAAELPRAHPARRLAPRGDPPPARRDQRPGGALSEPGRHRQAARHHRRALRRPSDRRRRSRLVARGVRGPRGAALRRAGRGHRRVPPADEGRSGRRRPRGSSGKYYRVADITHAAPTRSRSRTRRSGSAATRSRRSAGRPGWATCGIRSDSEVPPAWRPTSSPRSWRASGTLARQAGRDPAAIGVAFRAPLDLWPARRRARGRKRRAR